MPPYIRGNAFGNFGPAQNGPFQGLNIYLIMPESYKLPTCFFRYFSRGCSHELIGRTLAFLRKLRALQRGNFLTNLHQQYLILFDRQKVEFCQTFVFGLSKFNIYFQLFFTWLKIFASHVTRKNILVERSGLEVPFKM